MKEKKKTIPILIGVLFVAVAIVVGVSYAIWQITLQQKTTNVITTGCFKVAFTDLNPINLENAYPITDEEGKALTPYEFTITNTCDSPAGYQINLEILEETTLEDFDYIKVMLNESSQEGVAGILSSNTNVEPTLPLQDGDPAAIDSYKLLEGILKGNEEITYNLRLWLDENTPTLDAYMNQTMKSKITITTSYLPDLDEEPPVAVIETFPTPDGLLINAGKSTDNDKIRTYYYSLDGVDYVESNNSAHVFNITTTPEYGNGTDYITMLEQSQNEISTAFLKVEDASGNVSEIISKSVQDLLYDDTSDRNLRYVGATPNNYVKFNDELWRIIGVMNNVDDGTGKKESRLKIVRNDSIGKYSWDSSANSINRGYGVNEWSQADVMKLMNPGFESESVGGSLYWNQSSGKCYNYWDNETTNCDFTSIGLTDLSKEFIEKAVWYTGTNGTSIKYDEVLTKKYYELERGSKSGKNCSSGYYCSDTVTRTTSWKGYIGLISPSDYGYATNGGESMSREVCFESSPFTWRVGYRKEDCVNNNWLYKSQGQWTILPVYDYESPDYAINSLAIGNDGSVGYKYNMYIGHIYPSFYLKSTIKIVSGTGSIENPFILQE